MPQRAPLFHVRPLFAAACGLCIGTGLAALLPAQWLCSAALALAAAGLLLAWRHCRVGALLLFAVAAGLGRCLAPALTLPDAVLARFSALAAAFGGRIDALFPDYPGVARGMLLGARNAALAQALSERLYDVGVGHLLAVSGLHVGVLAGGFLLLWRRRALGLRYACIAGFLLFYCLLTGGAPSVVRASVMLLCAVPAGLSLRRRDAVSSLSLACCIVVLLDPAAPATVGFQLSFAAVAGILLLAGPIRARFAFLGSGLSKGLAATLAATLGTAPVMCRAFSQISVFGLCANLLVVPLAPFFLIPAFVCALLSFPLPAAAAVLATVPRFVLRLMMTLAAAGGSTVLRVSAPPLTAVLLLYAALCLFSRYCLRPPRRRAVYGGVCLAAALAVWALFPG